MDDRVTSALTLSIAHQPSPPLFFSLHLHFFSNAQLVLEFLMYLLFFMVCKGRRTIDPHSDGNTIEDSRLALSAPDEPTVDDADQSIQQSRSLSVPVFRALHLGLV